MLDKEEYSNEQTVESWVMEKCDHWRDHFTNNYEEKFDEYNRLWRGHFSAEDKTRNSERSQIISPALQQAVESAVAEIEEATPSFFTPVGLAPAPPAPTVTVIALPTEASCVDVL